MVSRGHALARDELIRVLTAYTGITTADGLGDGTTLVDTNLIDNPFISPSGIPEKTVLIMSGDARGEDKGSASFNNANGTITLQGTGFSAQIKAGTIYRILNISSVEIDVANINTKIGTNVDAAGTTTLFARLRQIVDDYLADAAIGLAAIQALLDPEIADLLGDIGDASGSTLGSLYAILGNPAQTFLAMIGYEGATSLADKLTAARAALIDYIGDPSGHTLTTLATKWGDIARSLDLILGARWDAAGDLGTDITTILANLAAIATSTVQVYQEQIPDTDFALAAIDNVLTVNPPNADAENSVVDIDQVADSTFVLRSLWVNVTSFGTGTQLTFQLWVLLNGVVTSVDSVVVNALGIQNLVDIFGLQEVHADGIWITVITDAGNTGACSGTYRYAEAKK